VRIGPVSIGTDTGGTFTDLVDDHGRTAKVPSTPTDPGAAVRYGIADLAADGRPALLAHGTTVATNALLERKGARTALVTTEGLADVIEIARQDRPSLYDNAVDRPTPLVAREDRHEVRERLDADGTVLTPLDLTTLPTPAEGVDAIAVCLLHSDIDPSHERVVADALRRAHPDLDVSASHEISPEFREYERTVTTVANASLRPVCRRYLAGLADAADEVLVLTSEGGLVPLDDAAQSPARLLLSGPAGGVRAAAAIATANGFADALTLDMGGTSTDVCLIVDGRPEPAAEREVAGLPIRLPSLDVHTIGAGGGSIARLDLGGALLVGPESAGADPGPACYGRGGTEPTVTDADLSLGRIPADSTFPGLGRLDVNAARVALDRAGVSPEGVLAVVDAHMVRALRHVSIERGVDPRGLVLVAFGGAGPLHACGLAAELGIETVVVPPRAGVFSAVGVLCSPRQIELVRSWPAPLDHRGADAAARDLEAAAAAELAGEGPVTCEVAFDCRYEGQSHELRVPGLDTFTEHHRRRNGYERPSPVEVVAVRAVARRPAPLEVTDLPGVERETARGPAVIAEADCTIWVPEGWVARVGEAGALLLTQEGTS
jgi:N-methylhydantoinase A/oxoprolinase/acetone carboxylase beta subunit